jgi:hypothetical protein
MVDTFSSVVHISNWTTATPQKSGFQTSQELNISGWLALVTFCTCLLLSVSLTLRGMRWLRSNVGHREHSQLLQDVAETELKGRGLGHWGLVFGVVYFGGFLVTSS